MQRLAYVLVSWLDSGCVDKEMVGNTLGINEGMILGLAVGGNVGFDEGTDKGMVLGIVDGDALGIKIGYDNGITDSCADGEIEGWRDGKIVGTI